MSIQSHQLNTTLGNELPSSLANSSDQSPRIIIIGGGLAGLSTAVRLAEHNQPVTLIETRQRLGGRATSFVDPKTGDVLDNCQHVLMKCCTSLIDLYDRLGVGGRMTWHDTLYFANAQGHIDVLKPDPLGLPAPLHLTRSMMGFKNLTWPEKIAIGKAVRAIMRIGKAGREQYQNTSFAEFLQAMKQPPGAIKKYWDVVIVSACNEQLDQCSAAYAMQVFQEGFLNHEDSYQMGVSDVPLLDLYDPAEKLIEEAGGKLMLTSGARRFIDDGQRITGVELSSDEVIEGDLFISAVPFDRLGKLASDAMKAQDPRLQQLDQIQVSPIIGIHLFFDAPEGESNPVIDLPHLVLMESPLQWMFNKGIENLNGQTVQHLHGVISGAHDLVDQPADELIAMAVRELRQVLPNLRKVELIHGRAVKEKRATFAVKPGIDAYRPQATGSIDNLILAGDWTDTGWPATMEGATRSGYTAAAAAMDWLSKQHDITPVADLPDRPLYRLLSR